MIIAWFEEAWDDYLDWHKRDQATWKRINELVKDIRRNRDEGIGKPEPLKHNLTGWWSRRIDNEHRLAYRISDDTAQILSCRFHYDR